MMSRTPPVVATQDGNVISFEVRAGMRRIRCSVSDEALEAVSGMTAPSTLTQRRKSFDRFRTLINAAAQLKLRNLPPEYAGPLVLTRQDLRSVPPETGVPTFGSAARPSSRPAAIVTVA
jgi:hypothetical protein